MPPEENDEFIYAPESDPGLKGTIQHLRYEAGGTVEEIKDALHDAKKGIGVIDRKPIRSRLRRRVFGSNR